VVKQIAVEPASTWDLDAHSLTDSADEVLALSDRLRAAFAITASDIMLTKTMLGVFGCVPAFDRYFRMGFGCSTRCKPALKKIGKYCDGNQAEIDSYDIFTLDFASGLDAERRYTKAKIIDMVFFQEGSNLEKARKQAQRRQAPVLS
jgi:hypothetical protein